MDRPVYEVQVEVGADADHVGPSGTANQQEETIDIPLTDLSFGIIVPFTSFQSTTSE